MPGVIKDLVLGPDLSVLLADPDLYAAVGSGCDLPLEAEVELAVFTGGDDAAASLGVPEAAAYDLPALFGEGLSLEAAPALGGLAVEEELPALRLLLRRQSVGLTVTVRDYACRRPLRPAQHDVLELRIEV